MFCLLVTKLQYRIHNEAQERLYANRTLGSASFDPAKLLLNIWDI